MLSGTDEPECRQRQRAILASSVGVMGGADATTPTPVAIRTSDDAPDRQATKALAHATIHPAVIGAATTGRELANPIAVN
jgi:hypothetical protein